MRDGNAAISSVSGRAVGRDRDADHSRSRDGWRTRVRALVTRSKSPRSYALGLLASCSEKAVKREDHASAGAASVPSIRIGSLDVIDDQTIQRHSGWCEFQAELLLHGGEERGRIIGGPADPGEN